MPASAVTSRYVTPDFRNSPMLALIDIMGLSRFRQQLMQAPLLYAPIMTGIVLYRHLDASERIAVNRMIIERAPHGALQSALMGLVSDLSVQRYWHLWSLSDQELRDFFDYNVAVVNVTNQFNPIEFPKITVASLAAGLFALSQQGMRGMLNDAVRSVKMSPLVQAVGQRFSIKPEAIQALGAFGVAGLITISGLNIMAKNTSVRARRELAARGLLVYSEL